MDWEDLGKELELPNLSKLEHKFQVVYEQELERQKRVTSIPKLMEKAANHLFFLEKALFWKLPNFDRLKQIRTMDTITLKDDESFKEFGLNC